MTEAQKAQATVDRYRATTVKADPAEYMAYMKARAVLDTHHIERFTAGQRGFMAAVRAARPANSEEQST